jgi:hypothetical protein
VSSRYAQEQEIATLEVIRRMLSRTLQRPASVREAALLRAVGRSRPFVSCRAANAAGELVGTLLTAYCHRARLSGRAALRVRQRAVESLVVSAARNAQAGNLAAAPLLRRALAMDPLLATEALPRRTLGWAWRCLRFRPQRQYG